MAGKKASSSSMTTKLYLLSYNLSLALAWLHVTVETFRESNPKRVYERTNPILIYAQTAAVLEILHAFLGIVKSPVMLTFFQVFSRIWTVWAVLVLTPETREANLDLVGALVKAVVGSGKGAFEAPFKMEVNVKTLCIAWGITEVVRYLFYFFKLLTPKSGPPKLLVWLRYSLFLVLYPLGVASELALAHASIGPLGKSKNLDVLQMPNALNISLHGPTLMRVFMSCYMPVWPLLFSYMLNQRGKVLGGGSLLKRKKN
jgi:very-long-chain (3R)-3-hydroxyacyl-CoA dehydratase